MLTKTNYRVWSTVTKLTRREKKLWGHITRTPIFPAPIRTETTVVIAVLATPDSDATAGVPAITRSIVEPDIKVNEDYDVSAARANFVLMQTLLLKLLWR